MGKVDSEGNKVAPLRQIGSWKPGGVLVSPTHLSDREVKGRPHLLQGEVWLLNLSQGVSEEVEHELLHLESVDSPQLLMGVGKVGHMRGSSQ